MNILYEKIGKNYNRTRTADKFILKRLLRHLQPKKTGRYLDIGCGTGNYTIALSETGVNLTGVDPSALMLEPARAKNSEIEWKTGRAEKLPFAGASFEGVLATLTIHHWEDLEKSFAEVDRVLKPDGRLVIFTSTAEQMKNYWLKFYFPQMLEASWKQMPSPAAIENALRNNGFEIVDTEKYFVSQDLADLFLYSGKQRPEMYLDENIRAGISSFSDLAAAAEVRDGLRKLAADIKSGKIKEIIAGAECDAGDYLFLTAQKK
jgi:SAM-dependent methyltransferase